MSVFEEVENIRRMAERGLTRSEGEKDSGYVDTFQHILDCTQRLKRLEIRLRQELIDEGVVMIREA
jgi:hypothetical protein